MIRGAVGQCYLVDFKRNFALLALDDRGGGIGCDEFWCCVAHKNISCVWNIRPLRANLLLQSRNWEAAIVAAELDGT